MYFFENNVDSNLLLTYVNIINIINICYRIIGYKQ